MASKYWIKLYHEILEDDKMGTLPDNLWRRAIELFLMAGTLDDDGNLPDTGRIAWKLRLPTDTLETELKQLEAIGIVTRTEAGWVVTNFQKRQSASPAKERMKEYRKRKEQQESDATDTQEIQNGYTGVTKRNSNRNGCYVPDTDTDTDSTTNVVGDKSPKPPGKKPDTKPDGPKKQLMGTFQFEANMKLPNNRPTNKLWWSKIGEIEDLVGGDIETGQAIIKQAVAHMKAEGLTIKGPESIVGTCRAIASGQTPGQKNGNGRATVAPTLSPEKMALLRQRQAESGIVNDTR